jgi:hypothetical protein
VVSTQPDRPCITRDEPLASSHATLSTHQPTTPPATAPVARAHSRAHAKGDLDRGGDAGDHPRSRPRRRPAVERSRVAQRTDAPAGAGPRELTRCPLVDSGGVAVRSDAHALPTRRQQPGWPVMERSPVAHSVACALERFPQPPAAPATTPRAGFRPPSVHDGSSHVTPFRRRLRSTAFYVNLPFEVM